MRSTAKKAFALSLCFFLTAQVFALPGVQSFIADTSGEFVYYRDKTFQESSIIGFIFFDEATYGARYCSPTKDISLYLTIDSLSENVEITGEKIVGASTDDTDIINYLHDLFYELTARRQKLSQLNKTPVTKREDYEQFGGEVDILFDSLVPLFNVRSITKGKDQVFEVETTGALLSSDDDSFSSYKGMSNLPFDKKRNFKKPKSKKMPVSYEGQKIQLDDSWTQAMDNVWLLGENASLTLISAENVSEENCYRMIRRSVMGKEKSYPLWKHSRISLSELNLLSVQGDNVTRTFTKISRSEEGNFRTCILSVYEDAYQKNRKYFESVLKSWK